MSAAGEMAMPESKKRFKKYRKTTRSFKRSAPAVSLSRVRREVARMIERKAEHKCVTFQTALVTDYATSNITGLANLAIGPLRNQRLGSHVLWKYLNLNFIAAAGSAGGAGLIGIPARLRVMVVYDKATTGGAAAVGAAPPLSSILIDPTAARNFYSMLNPSSVPARFDVLYDKMLSLNIGGGATDQALSKVWSARLKLNHKTTYVDASNTGTATDIQKGGVFLYVTSDQTGLQVPSAAVEIDIGYLDES